MNYKKCKYCAHKSGVGKERKCMESPEFGNQFTSTDPKLS